MSAWASTRLFSLRQTLISSEWHILLRQPFGQHPAYQKNALYERLWCWCCQQIASKVSDYTVTTLRPEWQWIDRSGLQASLPPVRRCTLRVASVVFPCPAEKCWHPSSLWLTSVWSVWVLEICHRSQVTGCCCQVYLLYSPHGQCCTEWTGVVRYL